MSFSLYTNELMWKYSFRTAIFIEAKCSQPEESKSNESFEALLVIEA